MNRVECSLLAAEIKKVSTEEHPYQPVLWAKRNVGAFSLTLALVLVLSFKRPEFRTTQNEPSEAQSQDWEGVFIPAGEPSVPPLVPPASWPQESQHPPLAGLAAGEPPPLVVEEAWGPLVLGAGGVAVHSARSRGAPEREPGSPSRLPVCASHCPTCKLPASGPQPWPTGRAHSATP